ncbi:MAG: lysylphosphatidylglycerol synthase domain-containing protein [Bacteroidia bacterium]|nr:lysylphosphatidylglycerol synthase domain-containing protein [Bacteroidia bacterium]
MYKKFIHILSWVIGIGAVIVLSNRIHHIFSKTEFDELFLVLLKQKNIAYLSAIVILMPFNWAIESWKWYKLSNVVENISYKTAVQSLLTGLAFGHLLPGRSSEFFGKILFYSDKNKVSISILHFINASFQLYITLLIGLFSLFFYGNNSLLYQKYFHIILLTCISLIALLSILIIYAEKIPVLKKYLSISSYPLTHSLKAELLVWSFIRYIVFIIQFYFVFLIFNPLQKLDLLFVTQIAVYFLLTSVIPMVSLIEVAVRALIGIIVFHPAGINDVQISFITTLIWLINLVLPSVMGFCIWLYFKQMKWK